MAWLLTGTRRCSCSMAYAWNGVHHMSGCRFSIIGGSCHKYHFCCDKHMFVTCLSCKAGGQNVSFVITKVCLSWQNFCHNKIVCHDKYLSWKQFFKTFVATKVIPVTVPTSDNYPPFSPISDHSTVWLLLPHVVVTQSVPNWSELISNKTECAQMLWTDQ